MLGRIYLSYLLHKIKSKIQILRQIMKDDEKWISYDNVKGASVINNC